MCGIAGVYGNFSPNTCEEMLDCVVHRGPNDSGYHFGDEGKLVMGMRRLSIIDLDGGAQPIYNEDGTVAVVFNGEIYNYEELRESLEASGHQFATASDTEVLVHLWEEYGSETPTHLNGMFAFAIWDETERCLFLARDRLGIKPLYVTTDRKKFAWASELQPLLIAGADPTIEKKALLDYFRLQYSPWPKTLIKGVEKLPPGHSLLMTDKGSKQDQYWSLPSSTTPSGNNVYQTVRSLLEQSVERRLQADVPIGAFLSGGIDSSAIVALMAQRVDDLRTYSVGFEAAKYDESDEAAFVADYYGTNHTELTVDLSSVDILPEIMSAYSEPLADPAVLPTLLLSNRARKDVKVVLTGEGADELFGGSAYYERTNHHRQLAQKLPERLFSIIELIKTHTSIKPRYFRYLTSLETDKQTIETLATDFRGSPKKYLNTVQKDHLSELICHSTEAADNEFLHRQLSFDLMYLLPSNLLHKVDFATMQASLEARTPFLDHELVEYIHQIPTEQRFNKTYKPLLCRTMSDLLPERTMSRTSQGFRLPINKWFKEEYESLTRWLTSSILRDTPYLDTREVRSIYDSHRTGKKDRSLALWKIINYVGWYKLVVSPYSKTP